MSDLDQKNEPQKVEENDPDNKEDAIARNILHNLGMLKSVDDVIVKEEK